MFASWLPVIGGFKTTCTFFGNSLDKLDVAADLAFL